MATSAMGGTWKKGKYKKAGRTQKMQSRRDKIAGLIKNNRKEIRAGINVDARAKGLGALRRHAKTLA